MMKLPKIKAIKLFQYLVRGEASFFYFLTFIGLFLTYLFAGLGIECGA